MFYSFKLDKNALIVLSGGFGQHVRKFRDTLDYVL